MSQVALQDCQGLGRVSREQGFCADPKQSDRSYKDHPALPCHPESRHCHREESREGDTDSIMINTRLIFNRILQVCEDEKEKRQDLYIKARSYQGQLVARKSRMIKESDFHVVRQFFT